MINIVGNTSLYLALLFVAFQTFGFFKDNDDKPEKIFPYRGYVGPTFGSPFLSNERQW